ncbi:MAG TPA: MATE family efflux transporter [Herpetosiphonaceae bacterium]|nr:MATE family efflux transporter [Herpetosiphonaceae bacterium]
MATHTLKQTPQIGMRGRVFRLAMPAVGEQFLNLLVGLVDTFLVGHLAAGTMSSLGYGSAQALAAVGLSSYVIWTATTLFIAVAVGATALIARASGAGDPVAANSALRQSLLLGALMGMLALALITLFAGQVMHLLGAPADVYPLGVGFLRITALSMPLAGILFIGNAALRGEGDTRTPLFVMFVVNGLNMLIAWLLVNGQFGLPALGVHGTAIGAAVGRSAGGLLVLVMLMRGRGLLRLDRLPRPEPNMLRRLIRIGLPSGGEQLAFQGALVLFARLVTGLGTVAFAAHNTVITIESISFLPGAGFAAAATTLVGQGLGAHDPERARWSGYESFRQAGLFMAGMGLLFILVPHWFLSLLVDDPQVIAAGVTPLRTVGIIQPLLAASFVFSGALRGAGDTRFPLWIKLISPWLLRLPLAFLLIPLFGLTGAWIALSSDLALQGVLAWWRFRGGSWRQIRV